jgi:hypothetical protein
MLNDDRHLLVVLRLQVLRDEHTGRACKEGNQEMVVAGQAACGRYLCQNLANNATKRILCQNIVTDMILSHAVLSFPVNVF